MEFLRTAFLSSFLCILFASCGGGGLQADTSIASVEVAGGNNQSAQVATWFPESLQARVLNAAGDPLPGKDVTFVVTAGNGRLAARSTRSDAMGIVQNEWIAGTLAGTQTVEIQAIGRDGTPRSFAIFNATAKPGLTVSIATVDGDKQTGKPGEVLPTLVKLRSLDEFGNPTSVLFTFATNEGGTTAIQQIKSGVDGYASVSWALGPSSGAQNLRIAASNPRPYPEVYTWVTATAIATPIPTPTVTPTSPASAPASGTTKDMVPAVMQIARGANQSAEVETMFPEMLEVRLLNAAGELLPDKSVEFVVTGGDAHVLSKTIKTGPDGVAKSQLMAGTSTGVQTVEVRAIAGDGSAVTFATFRNVTLPGPTVSITSLEGDYQTGRSGQTLPTYLKLRTLDRFGNPTSVMLTFSPQDGGSVDIRNVISPPNGISGVAWTLGPLKGIQHLRVTASPLSPNPEVSTLFTATAN